ncbi:MAG: hypothetical protein U5R14_15635 [Gemmatimonadota bacterium]|nr:hypothetical protein [Gemmatimonadota bacterium]
MLDAPGDQLETLLSEYEQRKQDETRRLVQKALVLEEDRKRGADYLRACALQHTRDVAERLQQAGHGVVYQELLDAYPPNVRIHLYPKASPLDDEKPGRTTLELTWGEEGSDEVIAKRWSEEGLSSTRDQAVVSAEEFDEIWVREQLLTFVREVLDLS